MSLLPITPVHLSHNIAMATSESPSSKEPVSQTPTLEDSVDKAKRAFALRKFEEAVDHYATALEIVTQDKDDDQSAEIADLYFAYGQALLENAISQASVLGKEEPKDPQLKEDDKPTGGTRPILSFSGDAEDEDEDAGPSSDAPVDLATLAADAEDDEKEEGDEEEEDADAEPEDDFNAAWEVLDLARAIYEKQQDDDDLTKLKLADTYISLGDVSLETEKFDQAISDYEAALELKSKLLPVSSRQIAEVRYKLAIVLDMTSGRLADSIEHAEKALESIDARLTELRSGLDGSLPPLSEGNGEDAKGKGKEKSDTSTTSLRKDLVQKMSKAQIEAEIKELDGLRTDVALKVEELKISPNEPGGSAPAVAAAELDRELNAARAGSSSTLSVNAPVNDLTAVVKKKKKPAEASEPEPSSGKRKAEDEAPGSPGSDKKIKIDDEKQ